MASWPPPPLKERHLKSNNYRSCSSSEDSGEEVVVCENDLLVRVIVLLSPFSYDKVLKAEVSNIILSKIN